MAGWAHRQSVRVDRVDRSGPSAVLRERDLEFPPRADEHAERIPDHRARSGLAPDRVRRVLGSDRDSRRPPVSVSTLISRGPDGSPMRVVLGGTFDILHKGHEALLRAAFEGRPEQVLIGLTTDRFARESRTRVNPYAVRERNLKRFLTARKWRPARIEPIDDAYGPADDLPDLDVIVVSAERYPVAVALNEVRATKGLHPLEIRAVPMVLAQDGLPIASHRIRGRHRGGARLVRTDLGVFRRAICGDRRPRGPDHGRARTRIHVSAARARECEGWAVRRRGDGPPDRHPRHRLEARRDRLPDRTSARSGGPHRIRGADGDGPADPAGAVHPRRPPPLGHVHRLDGAAAAPDGVEDDDVVGAALRGPPADESIRPRVVRAHPGTAEPANRSRVLLAIIADHDLGMRARAE